MSMDSGFILTDLFWMIKEENMTNTSREQMDPTMTETGSSMPLDTDQRGLEMSTMKIHFSLTLRINMKMMTSTMSMTKCTKSSSINMVVNSRKI